MPDNYQTLWLQQNLNALATNRALQEIERIGRALPCKVTAVDGSIVTVTFEVANAPWTLPPLTLPKAESQWLRAPTQVGDFGLTLPADTFLGGISGLGSGVADLTVDYGNMSALVWVPVGSVNFSDTPNPDKVWANGPKGVRIGDAANTNYIDVDGETGTITVQLGSKTWTFTSAGFTMSTGVVAETHLHPGVQTGPDDTGPPIT
jgi:hypothetical protein